MRIENVKRDIEASGTVQVAKATIKATPKLFDMFADQTYSNKPVAIMRELVANGVDAHVAAGIPERPVHVTLPTELEPMCVIKDFGTGMAHDFVMGPFMAYTDGSTKDSSNDQIGGFGIGSKSPFAYVDQFTLRVSYCGVLSIYTMFKDTDGIPAIGLQTQTTTDEPNGVEVSFPVEAEDVQTFRDAAQEALQYFSPMPTVENGEITAPEYSYVGTGWAMRTSAGPLGVIMGGVRYPVDKNSVSFELRNHQQLSPLLDYGLDITLPIGACGVAMSREGLSYTPKTSESILAALKGIVDDVIATFSTIFDNCGTEWEAMAMLYKELGEYSYSRSARQRLMASNARYQGRELHTDFRLADNDAPKAQAWRVESKRNRRGVNCPSPKWVGLTDLYPIFPGRTETVILDDLPPGPKSKAVARIRHFIDSKPQERVTIVLRNLNYARARTLFRGCPNIIKSSTLPEPPKAVRNTTAARPRVRMFTFDGKRDSWTNAPVRNLTPAHGKTVREIALADQPAKGIMVVMTNFELPAKFQERMETGLFSWSDLVFVNAGDAPKLAGTFTDFEKLWTQRLEAELTKYPNLASQLAIAGCRELDSVFSYWRALKPYVTLTAAQRKRPFGQIATLYDTYVAPLTAEQRKFAPFVTAKLPKNVDPGKLVKSLEDKQQKLRVVLQELRFNNSTHLDVIKDYL